MCDSDIEERLVIIEGKLDALLDKIDALLHPDAAWWPNPIPFNPTTAVPWYCSCIPYIDAQGNKYCTCQGAGDYQWTFTNTCVESCRDCSNSGRWYLYDLEANVHAWLCEECYNGQQRIS